MPRPDPPLAGGAQRTLRLALIGTGAGLFSGLFGVGGGTVIVPLLVLWLGDGTREAIPERQVDLTPMEDDPASAPLRRVA